MEIPASLEAVLAWAASAVGPRAKVEAVRGLRPGTGPWLLQIEGEATNLGAVLKAGSVGQRAELATEVAALLVCEEHG